MVSPDSTDSRSTRRPSSPGTFRLGTVAGVDVQVANSWFLIIGLIAVLVTPNIQEVAPDLGGWAYLAGVAFAVLLYVSVLLHEISHAVAARAFDMQVNSINLHFLGGATEIEGDAETPWREFVIAVVGPLTSLALGAVALLSLGALVVAVPLVWAGGRLFGLEGIAVALAAVTACVLAGLLLLVSGGALVRVARGLGSASLWSGGLAAVSFALVALVLDPILAALTGLAGYVALLAALRPAGLRQAWSYLRALG